MNSKSFLERAANYAELHGDYDMFKEIYECNREKYSVKESAWAALFALYGAVVADGVEIL